MAGAILTPVVARASPTLRNYIAILFSLLSAISAALLLPLVFAGESLHSTVDWIPSLNIQAGVLADPLSILMANVVAWISFLIMIYSLGYMKGEANLTRYWFFMNFFIGNMQLIVLSDNFLQLFFGWEGVGLCSYALIGFWHSDEKKYWVGTPTSEGGKTAWKREQSYPPSHAGMKAFVTTRIGDASFLIGLLILYFYSGTFSFSGLAEDVSWAQELTAAGLFIPVTLLIFGGAIGKSAQFPLQEWLPDAMAGPTAVSALIHAATMVKAGVFLMARVGPIFYIATVALNQVTPFFETLAWIGAITAFLAATQALVGREIKKVLAYSTVSQIGYMMLALGTAGLVAEETAFAGGFTAGFFHLTSHAIFKASLFMGAGSLIHVCGSKYLNEMGGLRKVMRITFFAMLLAGASLAGIPPLSGFWSKDAVLASILEASSPSALPLFLIAVVTAIITVFYTFRMLGLAFFGDRSSFLRNQEKDGHHLHEAPRVMWLPYTILAIASLAIGLVGPWAETFLHNSLEHYLGEFGLHTLEKSFSINTFALGGSVLALIVGGGLAYYIYIARRVDPAKIVSSNIILRGLYRFLENRLYLNTLFYGIFVDGSIKTARGLSKNVELSIIDKISGVTAFGSVTFSRASNWFDRNIVDGIINRIRTVGVKLSITSRLIQTGTTENYILAFTVGIIIVVLVLLMQPVLLIV